MSDAMATDAQALPASELALLDALFPERSVPVGGGAVVSVRERGTGPASTASARARPRGSTSRCCLRRRPA